MKNQLLIRLKEGDTSAFEDVYKLYVGKIRAFLNRMHLLEHADDVIQDTFLTLWKQKHRIDLQQSFDNYLFTIAKNYALKALKKQLQLELSEAPELTSQSVLSPDEALFYQELQNSLDASIGKLPKRAKQVFQLKRVEGLTTHQIANQLNISESTVENHMNRALAAIKKDLSFRSSMILVLIDIALLS